MPVKVFICYASKDEGLLKELKIHLTRLERDGLITLWYDQHIGPGTEYKSEIGQHLNEAKIILLLVSQDFIASEYCWEKELPRALERHERGEARVVPVIVRPADWEEGKLGGFPVLPKNARPITLWEYQDEAWQSVAKGLRKIVNELENLNRELGQPISLATVVEQPTLKSIKHNKREMAPDHPSSSTHFFTTIRPPRPRRQKHSLWLILGSLVALILIVSGYLVYMKISTNNPIGYQSITLAGSEKITIGLSDGSFSFTTQDDLDAVKDSSGNNLPNSANGEACIYRNNQKITDQDQHIITVVAVVSLSKSNSDNGYSFGLGNAALQGFCQKQSYYNDPQQHNPFKVRIRVANIGIQDASVLQKTMPFITQHLIALKEQDKTFIGAVGFAFSASLDDPEHNSHVMEQLKVAGIPVISTAASSSDSQFVDAWKGYFYRMNRGNDVEAKVAANYAYNVLPKKTAFIFYNSNYTFSSSLEAAFKKDFRGTISGEREVTAADSSDFKNYLKDLNDNPPGMIYCACFAATIPPDFSTLSKDLQNYPNLKDGNVVLMGADALYSPEGGNSNIAYKNMYFTAWAFPDVISHLCDSKAQCSLEQICMPEAEQTCTSDQIGFYATYCKTFNPDVYNQDPTKYRDNCRQPYGSSRPGRSTMMAYDALSTLLWAYDHRLSDPTSLLENVLKELPNVSFQGITGWIQLRPTSSNPVNKMVLVVKVGSEGYGSVQAYCGKFTAVISDYSLCQQESN